MYWLNFVALIICLFAGIWQGYNGNVCWCLVECAFVLLNLPYAIKFIKQVFED